MRLRDDTIVALATAPGRSAVAVVRLSGPEAVRIAGAISSPFPEVARAVTRTTLRDPLDTRVLDDALVTRFDAPRSYTGEDVVEFACHGGTAVLRDVMRVLTHLGARVAEPGEFTQRALLNGKLDLLQAEAVAELIDATTSAHRHVALQQMQGGLSAHIVRLRESLLEVEALMTYDIDFPEEDDGPVPRERILSAARVTQAQLTRLLATAPLATIARDGALVVLAGEPNAGKSALFNALLGEDRAIVTEIPGTTRDAIEARVQYEHWPLRLVDTAGLRETSDRLEQLGIDVSLRHIGTAHVVLACGETAESRARTRQQLFDLGVRANVLAVATKADLHAHDVQPDDAIAVSATSRTGLDALLGVIVSRLRDGHGELPMDGLLITRERQHRTLLQAADELTMFESVFGNALVPGVIAAVHVRAAIHALEELIGVVHVDDVLDRVFSSFCVGK